MGGLDIELDRRIQRKKRIDRMRSKTHHHQQPPSNVEQQQQQQPSVQVQQPTDDVATTSQRQRRTKMWSPDDKSTTSHSHINNAASPFHEQQTNYMPMDQTLYVLAQKVYDDVDDFIAAMDRVSEENNIPIDTILNQVTVPEGNTYLHVATVSGNQKMVGFIADNFPDLLHKKNIRGETAMHLAARAGDLDVVKQLAPLGNTNSLNQTTAVLTDEGKTPLYEAFYHGHEDVFEYLIDVDVTASYFVNEVGGISALSHAVAAGSVQTVKKMLRSQRSEYYVRGRVLGDTYADKVLEEQLIKGRGFFFPSQMHMDNEILQEILGSRLHMLLFKRVDEVPPVFSDEVKAYLINEFSKLPTPVDVFRWAPNNETEDMIIKLLDNHDVVENDDVYDRSMDLELYRAAKRGGIDGFISALQIFREAKRLSLSTITSQLSPLQNSFLHVAANHGNEDLVKFLLHHFPDLFGWGNRKGDTALHLAVRGAHVGVIDYLVRFRNDRIRLELALSNDMDVDQMNILKRVAVENNDGKTPLQEALLLGHKEVVEYLIKQNVEEAYYVSKNGISALYIAVIQNDLAYVKTILSTSSSYVDQAVLQNQLSTGKSLLHAAILSTNLKMLQEVAKGKAMLLNVKDECGQNAVQFAELMGFHGMAKYLRDEFNLGTESLMIEAVSDNGVDLKLQNIVQSMHHKGRHQRMIKLIDFSFQCSSDECLDDLTSKLRLHHHTLDEIYSDHFYNEHFPYRMNDFMDPELFEAATKGDVDGFISALEKYLDNSNSSISLITHQLERDNDDTFLHLAVRFGHEELSGFLIYYFPDFLIRSNSRCDTALHMAVRYGHLGVVNILLKFMNYDRRMLLSLTDDIPSIFRMKMKRCNFLKNNFEKTPLQLAFECDQENMIEYLMKEDVHEAYLEDKKDKSGLYLAVKAGKVDYVRTLFYATSMSTLGKLLPQPKMTKSLLHAAVKIRNIEMLEELLKPNPMLITIESYRQSAARFAESIGYVEGYMFLRNNLLDNSAKRVHLEDASEDNAIDDKRIHLDDGAENNVIDDKRVHLDNGSEDNAIDHLDDGSEDNAVDDGTMGHISSPAPSHSVVMVEHLKIEDIKPSVHWYRRHKRLEKVLLRTSVQNMPHPDTYNHRPLYKAAMEGDVNEFLTALENISEEKDAPDVSTILSQVSPQKNTLLHVAASCGHEELSGFIVHHFRNLINETNHKGDTALHLAARASHLGVVDILVRFTIDQLQINNVSKSMPKVRTGKVNKEGNTPLHEAMIHNHDKVAEYLINQQVEDAFQLNHENKSALYMAVEAGKINFVRTVLLNKSLNAPDQIHKGKSLIHAAIARRNIELLEIISNLRTELPYDDGQSPLNYAASIGFLEGVNYLLKFEMGTYEENTKGSSAVHVASRNGHVRVVKRLLQHFPDAREFLNDKGQNFLHEAAEFGQNDVVRFILKTPGLEVLINEKDKAGNTPLHLATINWHPKVVSSLTWDNRTNLKIVNGDNLTALQAAEEYIGTTTTFRQRLTWSELISARVPRASIKKIPTVVDHEVSGKDYSLEEDETKSLDKCKDRVNTLLLVATLVATVTFAAGFTMPGGNDDSEPNEGMALMLRKHMFHVFVICDTIAMYSSTIVVLTLIWAQLEDLTLVANALKLALPLLGLSLTMMSVAFLVGVHLVVSKLGWVADFVLIMGSISLAIILLVFIPLCFPYASDSRILRYVSYYPSQLLILASGSYGDRRLD